MQNLCGWGARHAVGLAAAVASRNVGLYGFAQPRADTTLPPELEDYDGHDPARLPDIGNARNYNATSRIYRELPT